ncbi:MAG: ribosome maturation factor RimP [Clostridia bacterium]|nr:ribosome maturation factor RimP [Clostridia bacterium]
MSQVADKVAKLIQPYVDELGLELYEVEYKRKSNGMNLTIFIDKVGGVTLTDCENLTRAIDLPLDECDPTNGSPYVLNVSSPGLDRPLKSQKDFSRNVGNKIKVTFYEGKPIVGTLISFDETSFVIETKDAQQTIEIKKAAHIVPEIDF